MTVHAEITQSILTINGENYDCFVTFEILSKIYKCQL
jgi:hypothetical protein